MILKRPYPRLWKLLSRMLPETLLFVAFCLIQLKHINIDFWNDEIYTLNHFTFVSFYKTLTDYHVPNNHVFFNLLNNIYLKLLHIDSLYVVMDTPYKLRVIPLIYSLLTVFFTYKIGLKFFNRITGLFASLILITTLPYFNFALQIRGYGISTLFLVIIVYYCFSYLKTPNRFYLVAIFLASTLIIFTIPSNIYPIFCILLTYSIYLLISFIKNLKREQQFKTKFILYDNYFHIIVALIIGVLVSLMLYYPIFKEVFMNDYVKRGTSFLFSNLKFYFSEIIQGMISGRWVLVALCLFGFLFNLKKHNKWPSSVILMIALFMVPILLVYIRGDKAPLRVFVVSAPFFSLLLAVGIYNCWKLLFKHTRIYDYYFVASIAIYSGFTFNKELVKIDTHILADIKEERRTQNIYMQYYSFHYQPLKDIAYFKEHYLKKRIPVLIQGCEPHGIPNYLNKFNIPFYPALALDSLLSVCDSIYIITNHPSPFKTIKEYEATLINEDLSYHNILLFHKKQSLHKIQSQLNALSEKYGDSIRFVFNVYSTSPFTDFINTNSCYLISETNQNDLGKLIDATADTPYLCYLETQTRNSSNINCIVKDGHSTVVNYEHLEVANFYVVAKQGGDNTADTELYFNSFEGNDLRANENKLIDSTVNFSGLYSQKLDSLNTFSSSFSFSSDRINNNTALKVSFMGKFNKDTKGVVVLNVNRGEKQISWKGNGIDVFFNPQNQWQKVITTFQIKDALMPNDVIKIYVWNPEKENMWIDDLKIELVELAPLNSVLP